jgi:uncharacterized membrane protein
MTMGENAGDADRDAQNPGVLLAEAAPADRTDIDPDLDTGGAGERAETNGSGPAGAGGSGDPDPDGTGGGTGGASFRAWPGTAVRWVRGRYDPDRFEPHYLAFAVIGIIVAYWMSVFLPLTVNHHRNYGTFDFDLGIFDQASWLVAHGRGFITLRGLEFLGHHLNLGLLLFAPAYWLGAGAEFLNAMVVVALAASVIPIMAICRHYRPSTSWYGVAFSITFLFGLVPQDMIAESFHPEKMAIPFMLAALWAALERRWRLFALFLVLAVCWKEDLALFAIMVGLGVAWKRNRNIGIVTTLVSAMYFIVATRYVIPALNGAGPFYADFMGPLGATPTDMVANFIRNPQMFADKFAQNNGLDYFLGLQMPWLFTSLLSPASLLLALPAYFVNVFSSQGYTQELARHYVTVPFTVSAFSALRGTMSRTRPAVRVALAIGIALTVIWTRQGGTGPWSHRYNEGVWNLEHSAHHAVLDRGIAMIPDDASVSAAYLLSPHLTRRPEIYSWPNPWLPTNWGINDQNPRSPDRVDWVFLDLGVVDEARQSALIELLRSSRCWETKLDEDRALLLHRVDHGCTV